MAVRRTVCPKCNSGNVDALHVPELDMGSLNVDATLKCSDCGHEWEGKVVSDRILKLRDVGLVRM